MITRENTKDFPVIKDQVKSVAYYVFAIMLIAVTLSLVFNLFTVKHNPQKQDVKHVQVVTKEVEKKVKGKVEKTKEVQTTEKPAEKPKGFQEFAVNLLKEKTIGTVILKHFFMYLGAIVLYLLFLVTSKDVSNIKVAGLEVGSHQSVKEEFARTIEEQETKFELLTFWMEEKNKESFSRFITTKTFLGFLIGILDKMQEYYSTEWNVNFSYQIYTLAEFKNSSLPRIVKKSAVALEEDDSGLPIHKESNLYYHKNYMIYKVKENDVTDASNVKEYMIVLSSYYSNFAEVDGILLAGLSALTTSIHTEVTQSKVILDLHKENLDLKKQLTPNSPN
ncbi:hypothetical protein ABE132_14410 [Peribacillus simplex]|uniref:hypothetical protein n=1 Tax=Peribacillus simplex TaxID=1478 RepID=UPI003D2B2B74